MPKPNQKRIESRTARQKTAGKLYIPDGLTNEEPREPIDDTISDAEFERWLAELLTEDVKSPIRRHREKLKRAKTQ